LPIHQRIISYTLCRFAAKQLKKQFAINLRAACAIFCWAESLFSYKTASDATNAVHLNLFTLSLPAGSRGLGQAQPKRMGLE
jgi:hypothetical protein